MAWGRRRKAGARQPDGRPSQVESYNANKKGAKMRMARKIAVTKDERLSAEFPLSILLGHGLLTTPAERGDADYDPVAERRTATERHDAGMRFSTLYRRLFGRSTAQSMDLGYSAPPDFNDVQDAIASKNADAPVLTEEEQRIKSLAAYEAMRDAVAARGRDIGIPDLLPMLMRYAAMLQRDCFIDDVIAGKAGTHQHAVRAKAIRSALDALRSARLPAVRDSIDADLIVLRRRDRAVASGALIPAKNTPIPYSHIKEAA